MFSGKMSVMSCVAVCGETLSDCAAEDGGKWTPSPARLICGDGRDDFEIDQRLDAEAADFFQIGVAGDSDNENTEEQRRDDDLDEAQENSAEELQIHRDGGRVVAEFRAGEKADENPSRQRTARSGIRRDEKNCEPTEERWDQRGQRQNLSAGEPRKKTSANQHAARNNKFRI